MYVFTLAIYFTGKGAPHGDLSGFGYTKGGISKGSGAADMMSNADTTGHGKGAVSTLQSTGARGQGLTGGLILHDCYC